MDNFKEVFEKFEELVKAIKPVLYEDESIPDFVEEAIYELVNKRNANKDDDKPDLTNNLGYKY